MDLKAEDVKAFSSKYVSKSGVVFRLVEMPHNLYRCVFGISKAIVTGTRLQVEINRAIDASDEKNRARITALFNRFIRFYKDHWVKVVE